jgi:hypothetical protein
VRNCLVLKSVLNAMIESLFSLIESNDSFSSYAASTVFRIQSLSLETMVLSAGVNYPVGSLDLFVVSPKYYK